MMCEIPDCSTPARCRGMCNTHYEAARRNGLVLLTTEDRFWAKVNKTDTCWLWTAALTHDGYAKFRTNKVDGLAHRWSYEHHVGPIPEGLQIDHLCRVRNCVNPDHLEPVTPAENVRRQLQVVTRTFGPKCSRGHEYTPENTNYPARGGRNCRACWREASRRYKARRAAQR